MATRVRPASLITAPVTPSAWSGGWNKTSGASTFGIALGKFSNAGGQSYQNTASGTSGHFTACGRFVSPPLKAQTISGTVKGQFLCSETASGDNYTLAVAIKVVQPDGSDRGVLLAVSASDDTSATPPEMVVSTATNRKVLDSGESASLSLSSVAASAGDYLVFEVGARQGSTSSNNILVNGRGDQSTDLPEDDTTTSVFNSWLEFSSDIQFDPVYVGSTATPEDAASEISEPVTSVITPPTGMLAGDLVILWGELQVASANASITQSELGGQSWTSVQTDAQGNDLSVNMYLATFDGTWDANPSIAFATQTGTQPATCGMHVFRPPSTSYTWAVDVAAQFSTFAAPSTPFTVSRAGQTTVAGNTVTLAGWFSGDDNTWNSLSGTGWALTGTAQYRNLGGGDQSATFAHFISATGGTATGTVSKNEVTLGGDAGITTVVTIKAVPPDTTAPILSSQAVSPVTAQGGTASVVTDEGNGTAYLVVVPNGDIPSVAQIKAGQQSSGAAALFSDTEAVSVAGTITFNEITGLSSSTAYDAWFVHTDTATNNSTAVKADFTTAEQAMGMPWVTAVISQANSVIGGGGFTS